MDCGNAWRMSCLKSKTKNDMGMNFNILAVTENGRKVISEEAAKELLRIDSEIDALNASKTELRNLILDAMIENNIEKCGTDSGLTFTQVIPAKVGLFDSNSFMLNEAESIVRCFTQFDETKTFDEERFARENPELYDKYCSTDVQANVDTDKLAKTLPDVFKKYYSEKDSDKPVTLRVGKKRGAK